VQQVQKKKKKNINNTNNTQQLPRTNTRKESSCSQHSVARAKHQHNPLVQKQKKREHTAARQLPHSLRPQTSENKRIRYQNSEEERIERLGSHSLRTTTQKKTARNKERLTHAQESQPPRRNVGDSLRCNKFRRRKNREDSATTSCEQELLSILQSRARDQENPLVLKKKKKKKKKRTYGKTATDSLNYKRIR
jgi:hypothetical protein